MSWANIIKRPLHDSRGQSGAPDSFGKSFEVGTYMIQNVQKYVVQFRYSQSDTQPSRKEFDNIEDMFNHLRTELKLPTNPILEEQENLK